MTRLTVFDLEQPWRRLIASIRTIAYAMATAPGYAPTLNQATARRAAATTSTAVPLYVPSTRATEPPSGKATAVGYEYFPTLIAVPARSVFVSIGVTLPEIVLVT